MKRDEHSSHSLMGCTLVICVPHLPAQAFIRVVDDVDSAFVTNLRSARFSFPLRLELELNVQISGT